MIPAVFCLAFILTGCASPGRRAELPAAKSFVPFAEGITAAGDQEDPVIAPGIHRGPGLSPSRPVHALAVHPRRLEMRVGETFSLKKLIITALDSEGRPLRRVPFLIEWERTESSVLDSLRDDPEWLRALRPGKIVLRFAAMSAGPDGTRPAAYVTIRVRP